MHEKIAREYVCGGGEGEGGGRYRFFNINDSIKIEKTRIGGDRVEKLLWCIILPGGVLICNLGESRERARCGVSVASLRCFLFFFIFFFFFFLLLLLLF